MLIPRRRLIPSAALLSAAGLVAALAGGAASGAQGTASATRTTSTKAGLKKATWGKGITITYSGTTVRLRSNGLPNHARLKQYAVPSAAGGGGVPTAATAVAADDPTKAQSYDYKIPTSPKKTSGTTAAPMGSIGLMISGAVLFNPYEGDGKTVAMANNFTVKGTGGTDVPFVDPCSGHPNPGGQYHYHGLPACVSSQVDTSTGPSHIIGIAFDGFPIYGARDVTGRKVSVSKLDACNGITSATPEFPKGIYHYVLPGTTDSSSSIRCFHGKVSSAISTRMPAMGGGPPAALAATASVAARALCDLLGVGI